MVKICTFTDVIAKIQRVPIFGPLCMQTVQCAVL